MRGRITVDSIERNLSDIMEKISKSSQQSGRNSSEITLVAVTKTVDADRINEAVRAGVRVVGENRVQEARDKFTLVEKGVDWHLIGHLQTNKAKYVPEIFSMVHSVDSVELANELERRCEAAGKVMEALVEVNVSHEESKFGIEPDCAADFLRTVSSCQHIKFRGIMTVAPASEDPELVRPVFADTRRLFEDLKRLKISNVDLVHLSMGMSSDYEVAIEEGATMVRIGSALFGRRTYV